MGASPPTHLPPLRGGSVPAHSLRFPSRTAGVGLFAPQLTHHCPTRTLPEPCRSMDMAGTASTPGEPRHCSSPAIVSLADGTRGGVHRRSSPRSGHQVLPTCLKRLSPSPRAELPGVRKRQPSHRTPTHKRVCVSLLRTHTHGGYPPGPPPLCAHSSTWCVSSRPRPPPCSLNARGVAAIASVVSCAPLRRSPRGPAPPAPRSSY